MCHVNTHLSLLLGKPKNRAARNFLGKVRLTERLPYWSLHQAVTALQLGKTHNTNGISNSVCIKWSQKPEKSEDMN